MLCNLIIVNWSLLKHFFYETYSILNLCMKFILLIKRVPVSKTSIQNICWKSWNLYWREFSCMEFMLGIRCHCSQCRILSQRSKIEGKEEYQKFSLKTFFANLEKLCSLCFPTEKQNWGNKRSIETFFKKYFLKIWKLGFCVLPAENKFWVIDTLL